MLAMTPFSERMTLTKVELDGLSAGIAIPILTADSSAARNSFRAPAAIDNATNLRPSRLSPEAVAIVFQITEPGEGGFEPLDFSDNPIFSDFGMGFPVDRSVNLPATEPLQIDDFSDPSFPRDESAAGIFAPAPCQSGDNSFEGSLPSPAARPANGVLYGANGNSVKHRANDVNYEPSPTPSRLSLSEVEAVPREIGESEMSRGEGEFVRLSASKYTERIELDSLPRESAPQIADDLGPILMEQANSPIENGEPVSSAWGLEITLVRTMVPALDVAELPIAPTANAAIDGAVDGTPKVPRGGSAPAISIPTTEEAVTPRLDAVSLLERETAETAGGNSGATVAVPPLILMTAGTLLAKNRWRQLERRNEECERRKPR